MRTLKKNRIAALVLSLCLLLQALMIAPVAAAAETSSATHISSLSFGGVNVEAVSTLTENPNGTYTLHLDLSTKKTRQEVNTDTLTSENGTYLVSKSGWYLLELWGGDGADGADTTAFGGSAGGLGGAGGYLRAKVYLEHDDVLFYALGGNGRPTVNEDLGGGANGSGGGHGASGSDTVGGGGGYSAVFLYKQNEFTDKYGSLLATSIDEADRLNRYIMIAGGGGGGGAGNGNSLFTGSATGRANGGAGGHALSSRFGTITGTNIIEGTFFAGTDGASSGSSSAYVGHGGTNIPGAVSETWISNLRGKEPNDWAGTQNPDYAGGAGGTGNLRGGAGGAGFCGGSGGVQTGTILPSNIGGGGGGSSFLALSVNGHATDHTDMTGAEEYLVEQNPSETGGALCVTYLGENDLSFLSNVSLSAAFSKYFTPVSATCTDGDASLTALDTPIEFSSDTKTLTLSGASLLSEEGTEGGSFSLTVDLIKIAGFAGGNNVPLLAGDMLCSMVINGETVSHPVDLTDCDALNVPLDFAVTTHSFLAGEPGELFRVSALYTDRYADVRASLGTDVRYDFIASIGEYTVTEATTGKLLSGVVDTVSPQRTTIYSIYFDVAVKNTGYAAVGDES